LRRTETAESYLRIRTTAEVGGVLRDYEITYGKYGKDNAAVGRAYAQRQGAWGQGGRRGEVHRRNKGHYGQGA